MGQPFVKDQDQSVEKLLKAAGVRVVRFERFEVGSGIEKKKEDFVAAVMAEVNRGKDANDPNDPPNDPKDPPKKPVSH